MLGIIIVIALLFTLAVSLILHFTQTKKRQPYRFREHYRRKNKKRSIFGKH